MQKLLLEDILDNTTDLQSKKVWYVAIIWRPNTGKSTFINSLVWEKIAITSAIPQTTRNKILAIYNDLDSQIIFIDTPGIHESPKIINQEINNQALSSMKEASVILYFVDSTRGYGDEERYIEQILEYTHTPVVKVYTKIDISHAEPPEWKCNTIFYISSVSWEGISELVLHIKTFLTEWPLLFPDDYYTKQDMHFRISEIIREKLFYELKQELPHSIFVSIEEIEEKDEIMRISAYIYTETDSQKYIVIGKSGSLLSKVWKLARVELESIFDTKVFLALRVKVKKDWRKDEKFLKKMFQ